MAGPGTARRVNYKKYYYQTEHTSHLEIIEGIKKNNAQQSFRLDFLFSIVRLLIATILVGIGVMLVIMLSYYLMMFHAVRAEGFREASTLEEISYMQQYANEINVFDIGNSYYPVTVKVER